MSAPCTHDITEREVAVTADGYCPLCMAVEIERLRAVVAFVQAQIANDCAVDMYPCQPVEHCLCDQNVKERAALPARSSMGGENG